MAVFSDPRHVVKGMGGAISSIAALLRLKFNVRKYVLWLGCTGAIFLGRSSVFAPYRLLWPTVNVVCTLLYVVIGLMPFVARALGGHDGHAGTQASMITKKD